MRTLRSCSTTWRHDLKEENLSDHHSITYSYCRGPGPRSSQIQPQNSWRWTGNPTTAEKFSRALSLRVQQFPNIDSPEERMEAITSVCESTLLKRSPTGRKGVYWWNEEIAGKRRECMRVRRKLTSAKRKTTSEAQDIRALKDSHAAERKALRSLI
ncbi:hypothetical protein D910_02069 [Dendroctonus ponderosae]|uniref:Uncharacterized protein n=1 Tax=Dendroctonus ponderosae TaxID=77166 RepID=U4U1Z6_DENPD|nr:hypothetical protein D910_02069 [Dendroctonus ponderosae]